MATVAVLITEDRSSGRLHKRYAEVTSGFDPANALATARRLLVDERCNLDSARAYRVISTDASPPAGIDPKMFCQNCFPSGVDAVDG